MTSFLFKICEIIFIKLFLFVTYVCHAFWILNNITYVYLLVTGKIARKFYTTCYDFGINIEGYFEFERI